MTLYVVKKQETNEISESHETNTQYIEYVKLLHQYFEIKNDEGKLQIKFNEIIKQYHKLVRAGIITV